MTIREIENRLWSAADHLWANTGLRPSQFSTPVLGLIFLRYAEKRFVDMHAALKKEGIDPKKADKYDYQEKGVLYLPKRALFSHLPERIAFEIERCEEAQQFDERGVWKRGVITREHTLELLVLRLDRRHSFVDRPTEVFSLGKRKKMRKESPFR